jgi:uncharacterized protein (DUF1778 family)
METGSETTLDLRLPAALKEAVELAAAHLGQTVDEFAVGALAQTAHEIIEHCGETLLTDRDWDRFLALLADLESEPNHALRAAAGRYEKLRHSQTCHS